MAEKTPADIIRETPFFSFGLLEDPDFRGIGGIPQSAADLLSSSKQISGFDIAPASIEQQHIAPAAVKFYHLDPLIYIWRLDSTRAIASTIANAITSLRPSKDLNTDLGATNFRFNNAYISAITTASLTDAGLTPNAFMYPSTGGLLASTAAATDGQLLIGSTGVAPVAASLTPGSNIVITPAAGAITIATTGLVPITRLINTTSPLTGGGSLAADLTLAITTPLAVGFGGTGQATALAAFNALSPITTRGDLITRDAANNIRLGIGGLGTFIRSNGTDPSWQTVAASDVTAGAALSRVNDTNVTLTLGGAPLSALLSATSLTLGWAGTLAIARGGTNSSAVLTNNQAIVSNAGALVELGAMTNGQIIIGSTGTLPSIAILTQGAGITITNAAGSITIAATATAESAANNVLRAERFS